MFKRGKAIDAEFHRSGTQVWIDVFLPDLESPIPIASTIVSHSAKALSERELEKVIEILSHKAEGMLKQHNFPLVYGEMLSELRKVLKESCS